MEIVGPPSQWGFIKVCLEEVVLSFRFVVTVTGIIMNVI